MIDMLVQSLRLQGWLCDAGSDRLLLTGSITSCSSWFHAVLTYDDLCVMRQMNEEEFAKFLGTFVQAVWMQLVQLSLRPGQVRATASLMRSQEMCAW